MVNIGLVNMQHAVPIVRRCESRMHNYRVLILSFCFVSRSIASFLLSAICGCGLLSILLAAEAHAILEVPVNRLHVVVMKARNLVGSVYGCG